MTQGIVYVATGEDYLDLAVQSARSLRGHEPDLPTDLYTDLPDQVPAGLFDHIHVIADPHPRSKLTCMAASRFDRTLFLDCDTLVLGPLGDLWGVLDRFDLALAHDVRRASSLIRAGDRHQTPYAFPQMNSGVMLYRKSAAMQAFLTEWATRFHAAKATRDQPILRDLLWESDLRFYVLPPEFNLRRTPMLDAWEPLDARPTILHSHRLMDHMRSGGPRLTTAEQVIEAERLALDHEWREAAPETLHAVHRFAAAQSKLD